MVKLQIITSKALFFKKLSSRYHYFINEKCIQHYSDDCFLKYFEFKNILKYFFLSLVH